MKTKLYYIFRQFVRLSLTVSRRGSVLFLYRSCASEDNNAGKARCENNDAMYCGRSRQMQLGRRAAASETNVHFNCKNADYLPGFTDNPRTPQDDTYCMRLK